MNDRLLSDDGFVVGDEAAMLSLGYRGTEPDDSIGSLSIRLLTNALQRFSGKVGTPNEATFISNFVRGALSKFESERRLIDEAMQELKEVGIALNTSRDGLTMNEKNRQRTEEIVRASRPKCFSTSRPEIDLTPYVSNLPKRNVR